MTKHKLLYSTFSKDGSLGVVNQMNALFEDLSRNSGWMELGFVSGFTSGDIVGVGTPVRLQENAVNSVPFQTGKDDPIAILQKCLQGARSEFFGLVMDEFQAGHFLYSRILLRGRLAMTHAYTHGDLVYLNDAGTNGLSATPYQGGEVPIGEWLNTAKFVGLQLYPEVVL